MLLKGISNSYSMEIFIDESIHDQYGFMLLGFVICTSDPCEHIGALLKFYNAEEYHASSKMDNDSDMRDLRSKLRNYINSNCSWGIVVAPISNRYALSEIVHDVLKKLTEPLSGDISTYIDEGIITMDESEKIKQILSLKKLSICDSKKYEGIQLADLVVALCGVRLREEISGQPKMLTYGKEAGFDPPIQAELGYELWASLRYSMRRSSIAKGEDMPDMACFDTINTGLFIADYCSDKLSKSAQKTFGEIYLGCIH